MQKNKAALSWLNYLVVASLLELVCQSGYARSSDPLKPRLLSQQLQALALHSMLLAKTKNIEADKLGLSEREQLESRFGSRHFFVFATVNKEGGFYNISSTDAAIQAEHRSEAIALVESLYLKQKGDCIERSYLIDFPSLKVVSLVPASQHISACVNSSKPGPPTLSSDYVTLLISSMLRDKAIGENGARSDEALKDQFGNEHFNCSFFLKPDGQIENLRLDNTSGFPEYDKRALDLIAAGVPFIRSDKGNEDIFCTLNFPQVSASISWASTAQKFLYSQQVKGLFVEFREDETIDRNAPMTRCNWKIAGDNLHRPSPQLITACGNVIVRVDGQNALLNADQIDFDFKTKIINATGKVELLRNGILSRFSNTRFKISSPDFLITEPQISVSDLVELDRSKLVPLDVAVP